MGLFSKKNKIKQNNKSKLPFDYIFAIGFICFQVSLYIIYVIFLFLQFLVCKE